MSTKAGVWIDFKRAVIVLITETGHEVKKVAFDVGQPMPSRGGNRSTHSYSARDFVADDKLERRTENDRKSFFDDVAAAVKDADSLVILGPGEAKGQLSKRIRGRKLRSRAVELEAADTMTDRQLVALAKKHFASLTSPKAPAAKTRVKKKTAKRPTGNGKRK